MADVIAIVAPEPIRLEPTQENIDALQAAFADSNARPMELIAGELLLVASGHRAGPNRWVDLADDHLQQGFMALTRAVAQPTTY